MRTALTGGAAGLLVALGYLLTVVGPDLAWDATAVGFAIDAFLFSCFATTQVLIP